QKPTTTSIMSSSVKRIKINNEDLHDDDTANAEEQQTATQFAHWIQDAFLFIATEPARQELSTMDVTGSSVSGQAGDDDGDH
ncbi:hypothetical protein BGX26_002699, partial [Mortierella sp. AD094]